jgi:hypothetical protein
MMRALFHLFLLVSLALQATHTAGGTFLPEDSSGAGDEAAAYSLSAFGYWVEGEDFFILPIGVVDLGNLHMEGRYNYEDLKTGSLFAGWNFMFGSAIEVTLTPMAGIAFGQTNGLVPALEAEILYEIVGFTMEAEYLFDLEEKEADFFYVWSELYASPTDWLFAGLVAQRMRVVQQEVEVNRGLMVGAVWRSFSATLYLFEITTPESFTVFGLEWIPDF